MTRRALRWLLVAVAASLVSCGGGGGGGQPTQIVLLIDVPPSIRGLNDLHLNLTVYGASSTGSFTQPVYGPRDITGASWPYLVAIAPQNGDATRKWRAEVTVTSSSVSQAYAGSAESGYVDGHAVQYDLCLQACSDPMCTTPPPGTSSSPGDYDNIVPATLNCMDTTPIAFCTPPQDAAPAITADLSCMGVARPTGITQSYNMQFTDLENVPLTMPCVAVYPMAAVPPNPVCNTTPAGSFQAILTANGGFSYAAESDPATPIIYTVGVGPVPSDPSVPIPARALSVAERDAWTMQGINWQANTALAVIQVLDCMGNPIAGARVRIVTKSSNFQCIQQGDGGAEYIYLDYSALPAPGATETTNSGQALVTNLPDTGVPGLVEVWAPLQSGWQVIGCEPIPLRPGEATVAIILPRDDTTGVCPDVP